jgi:hypothetical protein
MDNNAHFVAFLDTTVNLKQWKLDKLDGHVTAIVNALQKDTDVGPLYKEHIPQGSWAHATIIEPVGAFDQFDADFLLHLEEDETWSEDPGEYLRKVRAAFKATSTYKDKVTKKNRCVRIEYAGDCHVDVVPHLTLSDDRQVIINYAENIFEDTNPGGFSDWMQERDTLTGGNLRKVIRLMKYLRDYKNTFDCVSVILTTLLASRVQAFNADSRYADIPTAFVSLLEDLDSWLADYDEMPLLDDPSCPGTSFNHRWTEEKYQNFKTMITKYAGWAREAINAEEDKALVAWQKLFGPEFTTPVVEAARKAVTTYSIRASTRPPTARAPQEEFIEEKGYRFSARHMARIEGRVEELGGFRSRPIRSRKSVRRGMSLVFSLHTDTPGQFEVIWKVRNHGEPASLAGNLRGQLLKSDFNSRIRRETTRYPGRHYIEVYVVKNGVVVASDHHEVIIE